MDIRQLDKYFDNNSTGQPSNRYVLSRYSRIVKLTKIAFPAIAALLIGMLVIYPSLQKDTKDFKLDITLPKKGELEKLHITNTTFYITDKNNKVSNFTASNIDETTPGSKIIKLTLPEGIIPQDNERWFTVKAPLGFFDQNNNLLELQQNVELFYNEGMNISTSSAFFDFNTRKGYGNDLVSGQGFLGDFKSQGFEINNKENILILNGRTEITIKEESFKQ